ncbi:MAG: SMC family ATPase [Bacteroidota bacterium]
MIPVRLTIKGLYSYQDKQTIDFKPLMDGQVFGIFGPVGSGKSSILEAICFALYNETERLLKKGDNRNYNMMNLKSDAMLIDFEFRNFDDKEYRFVVKGKRNAKNFNKVPKLSRDVYTKIIEGDQEKWENIGDTTAESILGLSYENFRRTIIIPQGRFQEFLQLGDKARTDMLKELFHLNKYEFFRQTSDLYFRNQEQITFLEGQLTRFDEIGKALLSQRIQEQKAIEEELGSARKTLHEIEEKEKEQAILKSRFEELIQTRSSLEILQNQLPQIEALRQLVTDFEYCLKHFNPIQERLKELKEISQTKLAGLKTEMEQLENCTIELEKQTENFEEVKTQFERIDDLKKEISDYTILASLMHAQKSKVNLVSKETEKINEQSVVVNEINKSTQNFEANKTRLKELKSSIPDAFELAELGKWFDQKMRFKEKSQQAIQFSKDSKSALLNFKKSWFEKLDEDIVSQISNPENGPSVDHLAKVVELIENHENQLTESLSILENLRLHAKLEAFKHELEQGEPCPLCGALEHPDILMDDNIPNKLEEVEADFSKKKAFESNLHSAKTVIEHGLGIQVELLEKVTFSIKEVDHADKGLSAHLKAFRWSSFNPDDSVDFEKKLESMRQNSKAVQQLESTIEQLEIILNNLKQKEASISIEVNNFKTQIAGINAEIKTLKSQLGLLSEKDMPVSQTQLENKQISLQNEVERINVTYQRLQKEIDRLTKRKASLKGVTDQMKKEYESLEKQILVLNQDLDKQINLSDFESNAQVTSILANELSLEEEKRKLSTYDQQRFRHTEDEKKLKTLLEEAGFEIEHFHALSEELLEKKKKVEILNTKSVHLKSQIKNLEKELEEKELLVKKLEKLKLRGADLGKLRNLFKGGGFVNFISSVYLENLCKSANIRFSKLTRQQLRLEIDEHNNFEVKDFLNDGKSRSVKTLSGGQTFQAALSLALALADSVQQQNKANQNFFFLDEGFGSLDRESLQIVFETLKSLRKENRIVGVISHVEDLQQEIDVFLKVRNDPEKGSKVSHSWTP